ncbi:small secreted protein [Streptomyces sp. NPDC004134]|uniref:small secreted protein n=1 Tax=Streptomyces sp. NPDC004134 TaxID=3364691 RepID=UPI00367BE0C5
MNKKLAAALAGAAVTLLAAAGCSDDNGAEVQKWAGSLCDRIQPELQKRDQANLAISEATTEKDPAKVQEADAQAFGEISEAYTAMSKAVNKVGAPPVDDGKNTHGGAVTELQQVAAAYADLQKQVEDLDVKDQAAFAEGLRELAGEADKISKSGDEALNKLQAGEVGQALAEQEGCQKSKAKPSQKA